MRLVWLVKEHDETITRATHDAAVVAIARIGRLVGVEFSDEAVVLVTDNPAMGGYPLARHYGIDGSEVWSIDYTSINEQLLWLTAEEFRATGLRAVPVFERDANHWLRKQFIDWDEAAIIEVLHLLPMLHRQIDDYLENLEARGEGVFPPPDWTWDTFLETPTAPAAHAHLEAGLEADTAYWTTMLFNHQLTIYMLNYATPLLLRRLITWPRERVNEILRRIPYLYALALRLGHEDDD